MEKQSAKVSLFTLIVSAIIWLGAVNVRAVIGNELLHFGTLEFKENLDPGLEREVFRLINLSSLIVIGGYLATFASAVAFARTTPLRFKEHGWFMMSALLFFIFSPVEFYTLFLDWKMISLDFFTNPTLREFRVLFIHRLAALAGVPMIALLCYYTIIGFAIWQPMKKVGLPKTT
ncbi:MAG TPA: hypothetical protein VMM58_04800 [Bacteroidota bacterium]|nr:hypothetical protein [Bacteroidota bacterium]